MAEPRVIGMMRCYADLVARVSAVKEKYRRLLVFVGVRGKSTNTNITVINWPPLFGAVWVCILDIVGHRRRFRLGGNDGQDITGYTA